MPTVRDLEALANALEHSGEAQAAHERWLWFMRQVESGGMPGYAEWHDGAFTLWYSEGPSLYDKAPRPPDLQLRRPLPPSVPAALRDEASRWVDHATAVMQAGTARSKGVAADHLRLAALLEAVAGACENAQCKVSLSARRGSVGPFLHTAEQENVYPVAVCLHVAGVAHVDFQSPYDHGWKGPSAEWNHACSAVSWCRDPRPEQERRLHCADPDCPGTGKCRTQHPVVHELTVDAATALRALPQPRQLVDRSSPWRGSR